MASIAHRRIYDYHQSFGSLSKHLSTEEDVNLTFFSCLCCCKLEILQTSVLSLIRSPGTIYHSSRSCWDVSPDAFFISLYIQLPPIRVLLTCYCHSFIALQTGIDRSQLRILLFGMKMTLSRMLFLCSAIAFALMVTVIRGAVKVHHKCQIRSRASLRDEFLRSKCHGEWLRCLPHHSRSTGINLKVQEASTTPYGNAYYKKQLQEQQNLSLTGRICVWQMLHKHAQAAQP